MTDAAPVDALDPWTLPDAAALLDASLDPARAVCLPEPDAHAIGRAIVALANTRGGDILVGITPDGDGRITSFPGIDPSRFAEAVTAAVKTIDPPVSHLVQQRANAPGSPQARDKAVVARPVQRNVQHCGKHIPGPGGI